MSEERRSTSDGRITSRGRTKRAKQEGGKKQIPSEKERRVEPQRGRRASDQYRGQLERKDARTEERAGRAQIE